MGVTVIGGVPETDWVSAPVPENDGVPVDEEAGVVVPGADVVGVWEAVAVDTGVTVTSGV